MRSGGSVVVQEGKARSATTSRSPLPYYPSLHTRYSSNGRPHSSHLTHISSRDTPRSLLLTSHPSLLPPDSFPIPPISSDPLSRKSVSSPLSHSYICDARHHNHLSAVAVSCTSTSSMVGYDIQEWARRGVRTLFSFLNDFVERLSGQNFAVIDDLYGRLTRWRRSGCSDIVN